MTRFRNITLASTSVLACVAFASPAFAQPAQPAPSDTEAETVQEDNNAQATAGDEQDIVVTGSRIARPELETAAPLIASVGSEELETRAFTNVAAALDEVPGFGIPVSEAGDQGQFSVGQNFVNLFGIGSNRTLTLVNGRRFVSSNTASVLASGATAGLQVDLNVIPVSLIERIDVLAVKGASTYGSDAIAGTVNLILKDDFEGLDVRGQLGITERGDRPTVYASATLGGNIGDGRGNVVFNAEFDQRDGILATAREDTSPSTFFVTPVAGTSQFSRILVRDRRIPAINQNGIPTRAGTGGNGLPQFGGFTNAAGNVLQFNRAGELVPYNLGAPTGGSVDFVGGQGFSLSDTQQILGDVKRITAYSLGHYNVTDDIRVFYEASYANIEATELRNQPFYQSALFGQPGAGLGILVSNPFVSQQARSQLLRPGNLADANGVPTLNFDLNGDGVNDETRFFLQRALVDVANNNPNRSQLDLFRLVGGVDGSFEVADREFNWNVSYNYGRSQAIAQSTQLVQSNFILAVDAVGVTQADISRLAGITGNQVVNVIRNGSLIRNVGEAQLQVGDIACRIQVNPTSAANVPGAGVPGTPRNPDNVAGCVPLNLIGEGNALPEAVDFVTAISNSESRNEQNIFNANIGGELFRLWGNPISFNIGYERRQEKQSFTPDAFLQEGLGRSVGIPPVTGEFTTNEYYGELLLPLIQPSNDFFIHSLELDASARQIEHSFTGGDLVWSVGGRVAPIRDITLRGSFTRSVRAPAITELFSPRIETFSFADDPCDQIFITQGPDPARRAANCAAAGITQPFNSTIRSASQRINSSGNPNLRSERSESWTAGVILQPSFIRGLTVTADWVDIKLEDAIQSLTLTQVLRACYDSPDFGPNNVACARFNRGAGGQLTEVSGARALVGFENAGLFEFAGLQASARYGFDLGRTFGASDDLGRLNLSLRYFYVDRLNITVAGVPNPNAGEIGNFQHSVTGTVGWENEQGTSLTFTGRWLSSARFDLDDSPTGRDILGVPAHYEMDATFGQQVGENFRFQFTIDNLLNKNPPFPFAGAGDNVLTYTSALLGRRYTAGVFLRF